MVEGNTFFLSTLTLIWSTFMSNVAAAVFSLLAQSRQLSAQKKIAASHVYADGILNDTSSDPREAAGRILKAMDEMGIGEQELRSDLQSVRTIREIEQRLLGCRQATVEANADVQAAKSELLTAQSRQHVPSLDIYRARYDEACERASECGAVERRLVEQLYAQRALAPRLFKINPAPASSTGAPMRPAAHNKQKDGVLRAV